MVIRRGLNFLSLLSGYFTNFFRMGLILLVRRQVSRSQLHRSIALIV